MMIRALLSTACLMALVLAGCAGSSEETPGMSETTPAAAAGEPTTEEPMSAGGEMPAQPEPTTAPATEPATPAAATTQPAETVPMPTAGAIVLLKVKDYDAWKSAFDQGAPARKEASAVGHSIMREVGQDHSVMVWLPVADPAQVKAMYEDKAQKARMKEAGVQGKPTLYLMNTVATQMDPQKRGLTAALVRAPVKDFDAFRSAFEARAQARSEAGIVGFGMAQDVEDPNVAYLYLQAEDADKLQAFVASKDTKQAWKTAGVKGAPKVTVVTEGDMAMYQ